MILECDGARAAPSCRRSGSSCPIREQFIAATQAQGRAAARTSSTTRCTMLALRGAEVESEVGRRTHERADEPTSDARWWHLPRRRPHPVRPVPARLQLHEGQRGLCFVRSARGRAQMVLTTYGRSSGFCVDPIEKKPLNHFYPGTSVLSFGTAGCNLACKFCQNWDISKSREMDTPDRRRPRRRPSREAAQRTGLQERGLHLQRPGDLRRVRHGRGRRLPRARHRRPWRSPPATSTPAAARVLREDGRGQRRPQGVHRGLLPQADRRAPAAGARHAGVPEHETEVWFEITTLLIPGHNDCDAELEAMSQWIARELGPGRAAALLRLPSRLQDDRRAADAAGDADARARASRSAAGLHYVYTGNVHDTEGGTTYLPALRQRGDRARLVPDPRLPRRPRAAPAASAAAPSPGASHARQGFRPAPHPVRLAGYASP